MFLLEIVITPPGSDRIQKGAELPFSTRSLELPSKESTTISHSNEIKSQNSGGKNLPSLENQSFHKNRMRETVKMQNFASLTTQHVRSRREIDEAISENNESSTECANFTFTIKYEDEYKVRNDFSMMYQDQEYYYDEYRVTNYGLQVCISTDRLVQKRWWGFLAWEKKMMASNHCNDSVDGFNNIYYYTLFKNLTVFFKPTGQTFTRQEYGVISGIFAICSAKLSLSCNDDLVNVKNNEQYHVFNNFSLFYNNKIYDYREYRINHDNSLEVCASNNSRVQAIWRTRNSWEWEFKDVCKCCGCPHDLLHYAVSKQFTIYIQGNGQHIIRHDYAVINGKPYICQEKLRPYSTEYTQEDLLMCNDSILNIKYDEEYKVWTNFSILYKNKMYDYTKYRVLDDSIKICNSTDNHVRNIWKLRNDWVKEKMHLKSCNKPIRTIWLYYQRYYTVSNQFTVYYAPTGQYFTKNDYAVIDGKPHICREKLRPHSTEYTQEDLLMCNDSIFNIKYDEEYKVWTNFSILCKNKMYDYTKYRVLDDSVKMCNSTDNHVRNIWKLRNGWVKKTMHLKRCNKPNRPFGLYQRYYTVSNQFTVYYAPTGQYFTKNDYAVIDDKPHICREKLRPHSTEYTQEDLLMCNDSIFNIKYDEEYKVWTNFSILCKNKMYDYTKYRVLDDSVKICNSTDNHVRNIWKLRNAWVKNQMHLKSCNKPIRTSSLHQRYYTVSKQFTVYYTRTGQYLTKNDYAVIDGELIICQEKLRPYSTEYTQEDLLMCNDSILNIKYDEDYKVWTNFSILYKNKVYDYTKYRVLDDSVKTCNSTDNHVRNIWKLRNDWVKNQIHLKGCNKPIRTIWLYQRYYTVSKQFTVYYTLTGQYFTKNDYAVIDGELIICQEKLRPYSTDYTQEDLLMCNDSILNIKYDEEYKVWTNFSILYKNKVYDYTKYRVLDDSVKICNSTDNHVRNIWKLRNDWVKERMHLKSCNKPNRIFWLYQGYYTVSKQFTVYYAPTGQYFTKNEYAVIDGILIICQEKYGPTSTKYTKEDLLMCNDSILNIKYNDEYKVWNNFSMLYKNKVYDYTEYRVLNDSIKICNSTDNDVRNIWEVRNGWVKKTMHYKSCNKPITYTQYNPGRKYTVRKDFSVLIQETNQVIPKYDYGVYQGILEICDEKLFFYITNIKITIVPLCALALSFICLLLLLIIYCMLPELRTLPGLNLMSLSFAFLLWQTYLVSFLSLYSRVGKLLKTPCDRLFVTTKFITYSILMNAAVNIYHLRKTFCGNTLVKADVNKWKRFFKYSLLSWGIPVIITIVYIIVVKVDALRFDEHVVFIKKDGLRFDERIVFGKGMAKENDIRVYQHITGDCISGRITPNWSAAIDVYGFQGCLVLYVLVMFFFTAYRIRQKLKASSSIAQKSNIAKNHKFVILLKLSTTTALSYWFPLFISEIVDFNFDIKIALYTVTLLTGAYIGIAFAFTRRNYTLLKKKYSPAKHKSVSKIAPA